MPVTAVAASGPLDLGTILSNLAVLVAAAAAIFAGVFSGWRQFKKSLTEDKTPTNPATEQYRMLSGAIMETNSMRVLTESNQDLCEAVRKLCARLEEVVDEIRESRITTRSMNEETHRLRVAVNDAYELLRRFKL